MSMGERASILAGIGTARSHDAVAEGGDGFYNAKGGKVGRLTLSHARRGTDGGEREKGKARIRGRV